MLAWQGGRCGAVGRKAVCRLQTLFRDSVPSAAWPGLAGLGLEMHAASRLNTNMGTDSLKAAQLCDKLVLSDVLRACHKVPCCLPGHHAFRCMHFVAIPTLNERASTFIGRRSEQIEKPCQCKFRWTTDGLRCPLLHLHLPGCNCLLCALAPGCLLCACMMAQEQRNCQKGSLSSVHCGELGTRAHLRIW